MPPFVPLSNSNPYPTVGAVLNYARTYANDAAQGMGGDLLSSQQPYLLTLLNSAWERVQDDLIDAGVETLVKEIVIPSVPPVASSDPAINTYLAWNGFFDGQNMNISPNAPADMVIPSDLWQRQSGSGQPFYPVTPSDGGLPNAWPQSSSVGRWEWRDDKIQMNGATGLMDLKLRYISYYADLDLTPTTKVPIMRSAKALGYALAAEFADARGAAGAVGLEAKTVREISRITNRTARRKAVVQYRRAAFGR